ncbi:hypothetical protein [Winogradskyella sp.]|uniref:hypothetical protein n=1 Tax=Winogradskyella sp. TaxID=1883156 RepID=UPI0025DA60BF|nr:hypothetical protein [Winogradskyella sp.]MBT8245766.1 hypothetical protein [Winogradskyella sp.]
MLDNILNIKGVSVLDKKQQSEVVAGTCSVYVHTENGSYWSAQTYPVEWAQEAYATGGDELYGGYSVTGYCCASCNEFQNHPSWDGLFPVR